MSGRRLVRLLVWTIGWTFALLPALACAQTVRIGSKQFTESVIPMPSGLSRVRSVAMLAAGGTPLSSSCVSVPVYSG